MSIYELSPIWMAAMVAVLFFENRRLMAQAFRDQLTGLWNRNGLDYKTRGWRGINSIIMIDLDNFKTINDTHGHQSGDDVLEGVARLLNANVRQHDVVTRYGGEEFVVAVRGMRREDAIDLAERLRSKIALKIWREIPGLSVTASFGVSQWAGEPIDHSIGRADDALYLSKQNGRNQVYSELKAPEGASCSLMRRAV